MSNLTQPPTTNRLPTPRPLYSKLLMSHMLVAGAAVLVAVFSLLLLQQPIQNELRVRQLGDALVNSLFALRSSQDFTHTAELTALVKQPAVQERLLENAVALSARILIVDRQDRTILFDSGGELASQVLPATDGVRFEPRRNRGGVGQGPGANAGGGMGMQAMGAAIGPDLASAVRGELRLDNRRYLFVGAPLIGAPGAAGTTTGGVELFLLQPPTTVVDAAAEAISNAPPLLSILALIALALVIFILSRWTAASLRQGFTPLLAGIRAVGAGNLAYRIPDEGVAGPGSVAESAEMGHAFNLMATQVQQAQQSQREFIANVSHDLKTPLTGIEGFSQAILDGVAATPEAQQRAATIIRQEAERLRVLVDQLLELARLESGRLPLEIRPVRVAALLADLQEAYADRAAAAAVTLASEPVDPGLRVLADPTHLQRMLTNLLDNALEATPAGGKITLAARAHTGGGRNDILLCVRDTGHGIPAAELPYLFDRFYRLDKSRTGRRGFGLGLAIVRELAQMQQGSVRVESAEGAGSVFEVRLARG